MNLAKQYLQWKLSAIDRNDIVRIADEEIQQNDLVDDRLIELSLSQSLDEYEFGKLLHEFVDHNAFTQSYVLATVRDIVIGMRPSEIVRIMDGLHWLVYQYDDRYSGALLDKLYWNLDYFLTEAIPGNYGTYNDLAKFIKQWLEETAG